jgi:hypothetical protein
MYLGVKISVTSCWEVCGKGFTHLLAYGFKCKAARLFVLTIAKTNDVHIEPAYG